KTAQTSEYADTTSSRSDTPAPRVVLIEGRPCVTMNTSRTAMNEPTSTTPRISQRLRRARAWAVSAALARWGSSSLVERLALRGSSLDSLSASLPAETSPISLKTWHFQQGQDAT